MSDDGLERWDSLVDPTLVRRVLQDYRLSMKGVHGPHHWLRVLKNGLTLTALTPGADAAVVELFALLHDSRRIDEDADLGHGGRAASFLRTLVGEGLLSLDPARLELLRAACERHEYGEVSADPTIGCCWDADRLELARLGIRPRARYLSTAAALDATVQGSAWQRGSMREAVPWWAARWAIGQGQQD